MPRRGISCAADSVPGGRRRLCIVKVAATSVGRLVRCVVKSKNRRCRFQANAAVIGAEIALLRMQHAIPARRTHAATGGWLVGAVFERTACRGADLDDVTALRAPASLGSDP